MGLRLVGVANQREAMIAVYNSDVQQWTSEGETRLQEKRLAKSSCSRESNSWRHSDGKKLRRRHTPTFKLHAGLQCRGSGRHVPARPLQCRRHCFPARRRMQRM